MTATNMDNRRMIFPPSKPESNGTIVGPRPNTVNASRLGGIKILLNVADKPHPKSGRREAARVKKCRAGAAAPSGGHVRAIGRRTQYGTNAGRDGRGPGPRPLLDERGSRLDGINCGQGISYFPDQRSIDAIADANTVAAAVAFQLRTLNNIPEREETLLVAMPT